jgi:hypothetical protein
MLLLEVVVVLVVDLVEVEVLVDIEQGQLQ